MERQGSYVCIDLKSFYASVECVERGLDPLTTNLVVADETRGDRTICLAVSPSLKALGVRNRCRLFEVPDDLDFIVAPPRMQLYIDYAARIYGIYLQFLSKDDIHVYSIDEAFMDVGPYLGMYGTDARSLGEAMRQEVVNITGIPATCGRGTNLYLAKVALDISAKHRADFFGELTEESYRATLWDHRPITDFWHVGPGTAARLARIGVDTMGGVAMTDPEVLYRMFGVDAEILYDHAWGRESVTMADIKAYRPRTHSVSSGQVLAHDYGYKDALIVAKEMAQAVSLELVQRGEVASSVSLSVGYHVQDASDSDALHAGAASPASSVRAGTSRSGTSHSGARRAFRGGWTHSSRRLPARTNSSRIISSLIVECFCEQVHQHALIRRLTVCADQTEPEQIPGSQLSLFDQHAETIRENRRQIAVSDIKQRFGRNAILRGIDLLPNATARERNTQIGGHRSGES